MVDEFGAAAADGGVNHGAAPDVGAVDVAGLAAALAIAREASVLRPGAALAGIFDHFAVWCDGFRGEYAEAVHARFADAQLIFGKMAGDFLPERFVGGLRHVGLLSCGGLWRPCLLRLFWLPRRADFARKSDAGAASAVVGFHANVKAEAVNAVISSFLRFVPAKARAIRTRASAWSAFMCWMIAAALSASGSGSAL